MPKTVALEECVDVIERDEHAGIFFGLVDVLEDFFRCFRRPNRREWRIWRGR